MELSQDYLDWCQTGGFDPDELRAWLEWGLLSPAADVSVSAMFCNEGSGSVWGGSPYNTGDGYADAGDGEDIYRAGDGPS